MVRAVRNATKLPLSVKTRIGWDRFDIQGLVEELEGVGIDAVTIHGRTKKQGFHGEPDIKALKEIKKLVKIPIIGNGGVRNAEDAKEMLEKTNCDGVMIGRGALGNPWIFKSCQGSDPWQAQEDYKPSYRETVEVTLKHMRMNVEEFGGKKGLLEMRKHYGWYFKGFDGASELRKKLVLAKDVEEVRSILKEKA